MSNFKQLCNLFKWELDQSELLFLPYFISKAIKFTENDLRNLDMQMLHVSSINISVDFYKSPVSYRIMKVNPKISGDPVFFSYKKQRD